MNCIALTNVTKKYGRQTIVNNITITVYDNQPLAITGNNGSGKSTLLKIAANYINIGNGNVQHTVNNNVLDKHAVYEHISYAAPYLDLIEEFTLTEMARHYFKFKKLHATLADLDQFIALTQLPSAQHKPIKHFSSGMKQRLKLALAIMCSTAFIFIDEPLTNLDATASHWYKQLLLQFCSDRVVLIGSNSVSDEIFCCTHQIKMSATPEFTLMEKII